jgi:hypothetical protein
MDVDAPPAGKNRKSQKPLILSSAGGEPEFSHSDFFKDARSPGAMV